METAEQIEYEDDNKKANVVFTVSTKQTTLGGQNTKDKQAELISRGSTTNWRCIVQGSIVGYLIEYLST
jgi:hypothetical protein